MDSKTKKVLAGVGIATAIGIGFALASGGASASGRPAWTDPLDLPTADDVVEIKTTICMLDRGGVEPSDLLGATLERVYPGLPWAEILAGPVEGDHPTVWAVVQMHAALVQQYLALPEHLRESWCAEPELPDPVVDPPKPGPGGGGGVPSNVIGGGWNNYPEKGKWPHEGSIGKSLDTAGYAVSAAYLEPGYSITTAINRAAVKKFQQDWNAFRNKPACILVSPGVPLLLDKYKPPKSLSTDGWIGPNTWKALRVAFQVHLAAYGGMSWPQILAACKNV